MIGGCVVVAQVTQTNPEATDHAAESVAPAIVVPGFTLGHSWALTLDGRPSSPSSSSLTSSTSPLIGLPPT